MSFVAGLEGGGTNTTVVAISCETGFITELSIAECANHWVTGHAAVVEVVLRLFSQLRALVGMTPDQPFLTIGFCMAGMEATSERDTFISGLLAADPHLAPSDAAMVVMNDSVGSAWTADPVNGATVVIAGTGSMGRVIAPGADLRCGGWGHMFGDEGSGYWIATQAVARVYQAMDGYAANAPDCSALLKLFREEFGFAPTDSAHGYDANDMFVPFCRNFTKSHIAKLARHIGDLARSGDEFSRQIMTDAGAAIANIVASLLEKRARANLGPDAPIVCVGSVWKSFDVLEGGFKASLAARGHAMPKLVKLVHCSAVGAALHVASEAGVSVAAPEGSLVAPLM
jgi:N-acetylglucosamine kinase